MYQFITVHQKNKNKQHTKKEILATEEPSMWMKSPDRFDKTCTYYQIVYATWHVIPKQATQSIQWYYSWVCNISNLWFSLTCKQGLCWFFTSHTQTQSFIMNLSSYRNEQVQRTEKDCHVIVCWDTKYSSTHLGTTYCVHTPNTFYFLLAYYHHKNGGLLFKRLHTTVYFLHPFSPEVV